MDTDLSTHVNPRSCFVATQIVRKQLIGNSFYLRHVIKGTPLETVKWANIFLKASVCNNYDLYPGCSWNLWEVLAINQTRTGWREGSVYISALDSPITLEIHVCLPGGYIDCRSRKRTKKKSAFQFAIYNPLISWLVVIVHSHLSTILNSPKKKS